MRILASILVLLLALITIVPNLYDLSQGNHGFTTLACLVIGVVILTVELVALRLPDRKV